jgi:hypothetical protein
MTEAELRAIEECWGEATAGPWGYADVPYNGMDDPIIFSETVTYEDGTGVYIAQTVYDMQSGTQKHNINADTVFLARSWKFVKDLLEDNRRLRGE